VPKSSRCRALFGLRRQIVTRLSGWPTLARSPFCKTNSGIPSPFAPANLRFLLKVRFPSENWSTQEVRGLARRARVVVSCEDRAWMRSNARVLAPLSLRLSITVPGP
jgi:hypothetical protein